MNTTKHCYSCDKTKDVEAFSRALTNVDGRQSQCKACQVERQRVRRAQVRARNLAQQSASAPAPAAPVVQQSAPDFEITVDPPLATLVDAPSAAVVAPPVIEAPPLPPLERAYAEQRKAAEKRDLKKEHSALLEENEALKKRIEDLAPFQRAPEVLVYRQSEAERADAVACTIASDWHCEETVDPVAVHGLNEYNLEIARSRSEHYFKNLLRLTDMMARDSKITTINLDLLGDLFSGHIHDELIASTALAPGDAARFVRDLIISGIEFLLRESSYILDGDWIPGNHGRMTKHVWFADPTGTSLETFMYHAIATRFEGNPRFRCRVSAHAVRYQKIFESFVVRKLHGYEVKFGGGVGGLTIPLNKAIAQWNNPTRANLTVLGHFHQFFDGGQFIVNGSLIGYNTFAQAIKASYEEPRQAFYLVHARHGGQKSVTAPIWLDK